MVRIAHSVQSGRGMLYRVLSAAWCVVLLTSCSFPGSVRPTVKIGLSAPFEGLYRDLGYEALHAVRLAVRQRNEAGGVGGRYLVELVALNDFNEAGEAVVQARKMAVDAGVMGVLGGWSPVTAQAATPEYARLGLTFLSPEADVITEQPLMPAEAGFAADYGALSSGVSPGPVAIWAYSEANRLLDALEAAIQAEGHPSRTGVQEALLCNR
jgi:ABC-type branched-subunit amino acid transport system substrate-binding protein